MNPSELQSTIDAAFDNRAGIDLPNAPAALKAAVATAIDLLDRGAARVAERGPSGWVVNQWLKKAVLLHFGIERSVRMPAGVTDYYDKVPLKYQDWTAERFAAAGTRVVPGAVVRRGAHVAANVVLMPSFVNIGAFVDAGTMVDTWATVGSCAQIGANVHLSGGAGIGGVLEPLQAGPVVIEDGAFIGARAEVAEGVIVREGAVLSMGVYLGASTKIIDRATGEIFIGEVPPYAVVVPGAMPGKPLPDGTPGPSLYCAVIVKRVDAKTRAKTGINELLRD